MIVAIVGPTGVGKTKMSVELAKRYNAIIINADAVQVYKELNIGSAKATEEEKDGVKHFLLDFKEPSENYTVSDYQKNAREIFAKYKDRNIIFCGGTGLYLCAALMDYRFYEDVSRETYDDLTNVELYELALKKDKNVNIDKNNRVRLIRFLNKNQKEVVEPKLMYDNVFFVGLTTNRSNLYDIINNRVDKMFAMGNLYDIINNRVDKMFAMGLVEEVANLVKKYPSSRVLNSAIGYKEVIPYLRGEYTLEETKELIKKNSRHYAKRQYTWFNNKMNVEWFLVDYADFNKTIDEVARFIDGRIKK